ESDAKHPPTLRTSYSNWPCQGRSSAPRRSASNGVSSAAWRCAVVLRSLRRGRDKTLCNSGVARRLRARGKAIALSAPVLARHRAHGTVAGLKQLAQGLRTLGVAGEVGHATRELRETRGDDTCLALGETSRIKKLDHVVRRGRR